MSQGDHMSEEKSETKKIFLTDNVKKGFFINAYAVNISGETTMIDFILNTPENEDIVGARIIMPTTYARDMPDDLRRAFKEYDQSLKKDKEKQ